MVPSVNISLEYWSNKLYGVECKQIIGGYNCTGSLLSCHYLYVSMSMYEFLCMYLCVFIQTMTRALETVVLTVPSVNRSLVDITVVLVLLDSLDSTVKDVRMSLYFIAQ